MEHGKHFVKRNPNARSRHYFEQKPGDIFLFGKNVNFNVILR